MAEKKDALPERKRVKERPKLIDPIDYLILAEMPQEGAVMGYYPLGATSEGLRNKLGKDKVSAGQIGGRLSSLHILGYTTSVAVYPAGRGSGWQITAEGTKVLKAWRKNRKESPQEGVTE